MVEELIGLAKEAREKAYAPYSDFKVGAALLSKSGRIYTGCNVENSSYGLTICAERVAMAKAVSEGEREFEAMAVVTDLEEPASPCGACRQFICEFSPQMRVILANLGGGVREFLAHQLLPNAFGFEALREGEIETTNEHQRRFNPC
ncbi:MAG: cytidine deaminase [bacterium]